MLVFFTTSGGVAPFCSNAISAVSVTSVIFCNVAFDRVALILPTIFIPPATETLLRTASFFTVIFSKVSRAAIRSSRPSTMALIASPTHEVVGIVSDESPFAGLGARGFPVNLGLSIGAYFLLGSSPVWLRKALHLGRSSEKHLVEQS